VGKPLEVRVLFPALCVATIIWQCYDGYVKKVLPGIVILFLLILPSFFAKPVRATSQQAYQDYLHQFDRYRQTYSDFQLARDTYLKYRSLTSQTAAVTAAQTMMAQRNLLLHSYLSFLNEKLNDDQGLGTAAKQQYQGNLQREITFLDAQKEQIAGVTTIDDATRSSGLLETHYLPLHITIRQTIIGVTLGKLLDLTKSFDQNLATAQTLVSKNTAILTPEKVSIINRWFVQIQNTRTLYQQKIDDIGVFATTQIATVSSLSDLDQKFADINKKFAEARQLLTQQSSYLGEVVTALQYK
jgi:hypothetical protein